MIDDIESFLKKLEEEFLELKSGSLTAETSLNNLIDWSSLNIMLFLAFITAEYNVKPTFEEIKSLKNLGELYDLINAKL